VLGTDPPGHLARDSGRPPNRRSVSPGRNRSTPLRDEPLEFVDRDQHSASFQLERLHDWDDAAPDGRRADGKCLGGLHDRIPEALNAVLLTDRRCNRSVPSRLLNPPLMTMTRHLYTVHQFCTE
jgi:hypothetical protein